MEREKIDLAFSQQMLKSNCVDQQAAIEKNRAAILELMLRKCKNLINIEAAQKYIKIQEELTPEKELDKQRRRVEIANQNAIIERQIMENLEGEERIQRHKDIVKASENAIIDITKNLLDLQKAHGNLLDNIWS